MIIFIDEDAACRHWLTHHRGGYALERRRKGKHHAFVLHLPTCGALTAAVRRKRSKAGRWIACSLHCEELEAWCRDEGNALLTECEVCFATSNSASVDADAHVVSRLGRDVLDYVLDVAIIHLEPDAKPYDLTVADVGQCLRKTPGQLAAALGRLANDGLVVVEATEGKGAKPQRRRIYPTAAGLRSLPYFADRPRAEVEAECRRLRARR